jgi:hypothetical protein
VKTNYRSSSKKNELQVNFGFARNEVTAVTSNDNYHLFL